MRNPTPWGPSPALGHYTYWPQTGGWELSEGARSIFGLRSATQVTTALIMRHQHPDDADRTRRLIEGRGSGDGSGYSHQHRIIDGRGLVHEVVIVGSEVPARDDRGPSSEGFLVDLSEVGPHENRSTPMVPIEFDPEDLVITPCPHCAKWWAEVVPVGPTSVVREWHQPFCPEVLHWAAPGPMALTESVL